MGQLLAFSSWLLAFSSQTNLPCYGLGSGYEQQVLRYAQDDKFEIDEKS
jgi:hypothetical protein